MFITYFHNFVDSNDRLTTKDNGTALQFATIAQAEAEMDRVRNLPYTNKVGRLKHAIVTDDQGYREIVVCGGASAELEAYTAALPSFDTML